MPTTVVNSNGLSPQFPTYLDIQAEVKPWLQIPSSDTSKDINLQLITDMACEFCAQYTQRPIAPTTYDRRFDGFAGWNGSSLMLPYYPILEVVSVVEYWGTSGPNVLSESTPTNQIDGFQVEYATGRVTRIFPGNVQKPFFPGSRNIEIVWTAGFNPIPPMIRMATLELIAHWFRNTQQQSARANTQIVPSSEYEPSPSTPGSLWSGVPFRVTSLLNPYISYGMA